jgi:hypothetical protein
MASISADFECKIPKKLSFVVLTALKTKKTNRFVYYRPRFVTALCLVLEHKSAKLDLLAVTDTLKNCKLLVLTDLCLE